MKIKNETVYRTDQLRQLIRRVGQDEFETHQMKRLLVTVKYRRANSGVRGRACYGTPFHQVLRIWLFLPRPPLPIETDSLALTIAHEMGHCRGMRHRDMNTARYSRLCTGWQDRYAYALDFKLEVQPQKPKLIKTDADKVERLLTQLKRWATKRKRAETAIAKLKRRLKHLEKKLTAQIAATQTAIEVGQ